MKLTTTRYGSAVAATALIIGLAQGGGAEAGTIVAATYAGGGTFATRGAATGFFFTPSANILVDQLGVFDEGQDGLASAHDVGIFLTNGSAVVTTTIAAGTSSPLIGQSRFVSVAPVQLTANTPYYILANNFQTDRFVSGTGAVVFDPRITWNGIADAPANNISAPIVTNSGGSPGNLGPNFRFDVAATTPVPEPSTLALGGIGLAGLALGYARRRTRATG